MTLAIARWRECRPVRFLRRLLSGMMLDGPFPVCWLSERLETIERPGGQRVQGRLVGDARGGFSFSPANGSAPMLLEPGSVIHFDGSSPDVAGEPGPVSGARGRSPATFGCAQRNQPTLASAGCKLAIPRRDALTRPGVQAVIQRPGEARVLVDGFETLDRLRWTIEGKVAIVKEPHLSERHSVSIPAGGASLLHRLEEPLGAGRFELAFFDGGSVIAGQKWFIELTFQGPTGLLVVRVVLGWSEESLAVESPSGPALAVQRLARTPGWHRFVLLFGPEQTEISVDGKELAHGKGPDGPLVAIRLGSCRRGARLAGS